MLQLYCDLKHKRLSVSSSHLWFHFFFFCLTFHCAVLFLAFHCCHGHTGQNWCLLWEDTLLPVVVIGQLASCVMQKGHFLCPISFYKIKKALYVRYNFVLQSCELTRKQDMLQWHLPLEYSTWLRVLSHVNKSNCICLLRCYYLLF